METKSTHPDCRSQADPRRCYTDDYGAYLPTPAQIAEECRKIQETWSPRERRKRNVFGAPATSWRLPVCGVSKAS